MSPLRSLVPAVFVLSALAASAASAQPCPPGTYSPTGFEPCTPCAAGTYNPSEAQFECAPCPSGYHAPYPGTLYCDACTAGTYSNEGAAQCTYCDAGTFSNSGSAFCTLCAAGKYSAPGSGSCSDCPAGFFSAAGSESCAPCAAGTFSSTTGSAACSTCPDGSIAPSNGMVACTPCPEGQTSDATHTNCIPATGVDTGRIPAASYLAPAAPNPARAGTTFELGLAQDADVQLRIHDLSGRVLRTLVSERLSAGIHRRAWNLRSDRGVTAAAGVYFARLSGGGVERVRVVYVLK